LPNLKFKAVAVLYTLEELAKRHNMVAAKAYDNDPFKGPHTVAAVVHGWNRDEYFNGPVTLSDSDYLAALEAAACGATHPAANRRS
jgi:hypothetical protein